MTGSTIFDKILRKEIPADVVHEDEWVLAFRDVNPQAPVHVVVIPKKRIERFAGLADAPAVDVGEFFKGVALVARKLRLEEPGYRIVVNNGRDGNQTVEYLHAHIIGGRRLTWPPG
jgi:histidine triad (HIT) family protein